MASTVASWAISGLSTTETGNRTSAMNESDSLTQTSFMLGFVPRTPYLVTIYVIVILGLIGNSMEFVLMHHPWYRRMSYAVYLRFLAVCDTIVLLLTCAEDLMDHQFKVKGFWYMKYCVPWHLVKSVTRFASPWLIVALTLDRFVAIVIPLRRARFCCMKVALAISLGTMLYAVVDSAVKIAHSKTFLAKGGIQCEPQGNTVFYTYLNVRNCLMQSTLPCFIILVFNIFTIITIKRSRKFRENFTERDRQNTQPKDRVTVSLIAVSLMAFVTLVPIAILETLELLWEKDYENTLEKAQALNATVEIPKPEKLKQASATWPLLNLIHFVNFAQNFYIMMLTGPRYRKALRSYACMRKVCSLASHLELSTSRTYRVATISTSSKRSSGN